MKPALLVIDIQRFFLKAPDKQEEAKRLVEKTNELIDFFHERGLPIIHIMTVHKADGSTGDLWMRRNNCISLVEGTEDAEELPEVHTFDTDIVVIKHRHSAFIRTDLENMLLELSIDALVLTGYATNACVGLTAIEGYERDFEITLAGEAMLGVNREKSELMLKYLRTGFDIVPVSNEEIMERVEKESL